MSNPRHIDLRVELEMLTITRQFFSLLSAGDERAGGRLNYDSAALVARLANSNGDVSEQSEIKQSLSEFRQLLEKFDHYLPTVNLRRHFEQVGTPAAEVLEALLRFYLSKNGKTAADRDKVDLIVTRWGQVSVTADDQMVYLQRHPELPERLAGIYQEMGLPTQGIIGEAEAIALLADERLALFAVTSLRELIDRQVLLRLRRIKDDIEELFFRPAVLTELVEVNLSLHNTFQKLLTIEQSRLTSSNKVTAEPAAIENATATPPRTPGTRSEIVLALAEIGQSLTELALQVQALAEKLETESPRE